MPPLTPPTVLLCTSTLCPRTERMPPLVDLVTVLLVRPPFVLIGRIFKDGSAVNLDVCLTP